MMVSKTKLLVCSGFHILLVFWLLGRWLLSLSCSFLFTLSPHPQNQGWLFRWISSLAYSAKMLLSVQRKHLGILTIKKEARRNQLSLPFLFYSVTMSPAHELWQKFIYIFVLSALNLLPLIIITCPLIPAPENRMNNHLIFSMPLSELSALANTHKSTSYCPRVCGRFLMLAFQLKACITNYCWFCYNLFRVTDLRQSVEWDL